MFKTLKNWFTSLFKSVSETKPSPFETLDTIFVESDKVREVLLKQKARLKDLQSAVNSGASLESLNTLKDEIEQGEIECQEALAKFKEFAHQEMSKFKLS